MKKMNKKGFTLVELLAVVVILSLMMGIAIPNVMGIIKKQKQRTYLEDAKKMISRAEYMLRSSTKITKPGNGGCIVMTLGYLDNGEFNNPPYGGAYFSNTSYVYINNNNGKYEYKVQLFECEKPGDKTKSESGGLVTGINRVCKNNSRSGTGIEEISSTSPDLNNPSKVTQKNNLNYGTSASSCATKYKTSNRLYDVLFDYND